MLTAHQCMFGKRVPALRDNTRQASPVRSSTALLTGRIWGLHRVWVVSDQFYRPIHLIRHVRITYEDSSADVRGFLEHFYKVIVAKLPANSIQILEQFCAQNFSNVWEIQHLKHFVHKFQLRVGVSDERITCKHMRDDTLAWQTHPIVRWFPCEQD